MLRKLDSGELIRMLIRNVDKEYEVYHGFRLIGIHINILQLHPTIFQQLLCSVFCRPCSVRRHEGGQVRRLRQLKVAFVDNRCVTCRNTCTRHRVRRRLIKFISCFVIRCRLWRRLTTLSFPDHNNHEANRYSENNGTVTSGMTKP